MDVNILTKYNLSMNLEQNTHDKIQSLHNQYAGKRCFIMDISPNVKFMNLELLKGM